MCEERCTPRRCWNTFQRFLSRFRAFTCRIVFCCFSIFTVSRLVNVKGNISEIFKGSTDENTRYWLLILTVLPLIGETIFTFNKYSRRKSAGKWFSPVVFLFLCSACPSIWIMRMHLMMEQKNSTAHDACDPANRNNGTVTHDPMQQCKIVEQMLLLVLIVGRWLLPRAGISRDQLSQLLLVNIGMAADIIELFEAFREQAVRENPGLTIIILGIWQASLIQFALAKTATRSRRPATTVTTNVVSKDKNCLFCETDLWAISISLALQDVPFLSLRMVLIFYYGIVSYSNIFFTLKNTLVIILQLFRFFVILIEHSYRKSLTESPGGKNAHHTFSFMFEQPKSGPQSKLSSVHLQASDGSLVGDMNGGSTTSGSGSSRNPMLAISRRFLKAFRRSHSNQSTAEDKMIIQPPSPVPPVIYKPPIWRKRRRPAASSKTPSRIHPPEVPTISFIPKRRTCAQAMHISREMRRRAHRSLTPGRQIPAVAAGTTDTGHRSWHNGDGMAGHRSWHNGDGMVDHRRDDVEALLHVDVQKPDYRRHPYHHIQTIPSHHYQNHLNIDNRDVIEDRGFTRHYP